MAPRLCYRTQNGTAYQGDSLEAESVVAPGSVNLIMTSPPYALRKKKKYGNVDEFEYVAWFMKFADVFERLLAPDGSLVVVIGGSWVKGEPTRSTYHFQLLIELCKKFKLAQEFYWYNPARLPSPAEWVTVRRKRVKDAVDCIWWLSKRADPKADNRRVLRPYSESMKDLLEKGYKPMRRPSGHDISAGFQKDRGGSIPSNLLQIANTESNSLYLVACRAAGLQPHPARYPVGVPKFFIEYLTDPGDLVMDPFAGSNVTGEACESLGRRWIAIEMVEEYLRGSAFRFPVVIESCWKGEPNGHDGANGLTPAQMRLLEERASYQAAHAIEPGPSAR